MSFMVGEDGVIYQKDLGDKTSEAAATVTSYNPGEGWTVVLSPEGANSRVATKREKVTLKRRACATSLLGPNTTGIKAASSFVSFHSVSGSGKCRS